MEAEGLHATSSSPSSTPPTTVLNFRTQTEYLLQNSIIMTEMGMKIREKCVSSEKYVSYLRNLSAKAAKNVSTLHTTSKNFLLLAQKLVTTVVSLIDTVPLAVNDLPCYTIKIEYEKLLSIIEKELSDIEIDSPDTVPNLANLSEKIKYLEAKQKMSDHNGLHRTASVKSVKSDVDEKYPENISRESLIDLNTVVNLPPVPEDIFTTCSNKPMRTSSLSSLKSIRKVKLFLQRAANHSDDEDLSSDPDDHEFPRLTIVNQHLSETMSIPIGYLKNKEAQARSVSGTGSAWFTVSFLSQLVDHFKEISFPLRPAYDDLAGQFLREHFMPNTDDKCDNTYANLDLKEKIIKIGQLGVVKYFELIIASKGDTAEDKSNNPLLTPKKHLGNIKEESQD